MRLTSTFRRALLPAVVAATAFLSGARPAAAQLITANYAPACGPGTGCATLRFQITNTSASTLLFNTLSFTANSSPFRFAPLAGGIALYQAVDAVGPFGGSGTVAVGGTQLLIDFLGGNGFQFELSGGSVGYVEAALGQIPALVPGTVAFNYAATLDGGRAISGTALITPEPSTIVLLGGGLMLVGFATGRRRRS